MKDKDYQYVKHKQKDIEINPIKRERAASLSLLLSDKSNIFVL